MRDRTPRYPRNPNYGSLPPHRRRSPAWPWLAGVIALVPLLLLTAVIWRGGGGETDAGALPPVDEAAIGQEVSPTPVATPEPPPEDEPLIEPPHADPPVALGEPPPEITAHSAIVLDGDSLEVLYERNAYERRAPASLTKIATAIVVAEHANLDDVATSPVHYWDLYDSTSMALVPGDEVTVRNLLYGLMMVSGNDAAQVIARHMAGSEEAFVIAMNLLVERLGLEDTRFQNPHGLTEDDHYSTAYDMALLSRHLMTYPELREVVGTEQIVVTGERDGETVEFDLYNGNPLLNYTPGVDGVKTGFTSAAGPSFAASADRDGRRIYVVLLNASDRANDAIALIEWAYEAHRWPGEEPDLEAPGDAPAEASDAITPPGP